MMAGAIWWLDVLMSLSTWGIICGELAPLRNYFMIHRPCIESWAGRLGHLDSVSFTGFVSFPRVSYDDHMALSKVYLQEILSCSRGDFTVYILYMFTRYNNMEGVLPGGVPTGAADPIYPIIL